MLTESSARERGRDERGAVSQDLTKLIPFPRACSPHVEGVLARTSSSWLGRLSLGSFVGSHVSGRGLGKGGMVKRW